jgi:hypothetical protein
MLQIHNLNTLIFINKNWSNDLMVNCFLPFGLIELIEINAFKKEDLEEYEGELKQNEVVICNLVIKILNVVI